MHMKKNMKRNNLWYIWLFVGLGIGITLGRLINWGYFELSKEISVADSLNIFITIGLTLYIANVLERRLKYERFKSDLYVAKICEIESNLLKIENLIQNKELQYQYVNTIVHTIGIAKNSLMNSILGLNKDTINSVNEALKSKHRELKSLLTNRPIDKSDKSVTVKNNLVTYSPERIVNIITCIYAIKEEYFTLKVLLNE